MPRAQGRAGAAVLKKTTEGLFQQAASEIQADEWRQPDAGRKGGCRFVSRVTKNGNVYCRMCYKEHKILCALIS